MSTITHKQAKAAEEKVTGNRFCTSCQQYKKVEDGGGWKYSGKFNENKRWACSLCFNKIRDFGGRK